MCVYLIALLWTADILSSVINTKFTAGTEKNPDEHDTELSLCWPRIVPGASRIQSSQSTSWAKCITNIRDISGMCTNMDHYMWMVEEYGVVATLQILLRSSLFNSRPGHRLSWPMFLVNVLISFWRMKRQYFNQVTTASSQSLSVYHTLNIVPLDGIRFKILIMSLINL
jgi:hypothetical protein